MCSLNHVQVTVFCTVCLTMTEQHSSAYWLHGPQSVSGTCLRSVLMWLVAGVLLQIDQLLPEHTFNIVSDIYIQDNLMKPKECRKLLLQLGVTDFISVPMRKITVTEANKASTPWPEQDMQPGSTYTDYAGAEFAAVVHSVLSAAAPAGCMSTLQLLFQAFDSRWAADYSHCLNATYTTSSGELRAEIPMSCATVWRLARTTDSWRYNI